MSKNHGRRLLIAGRGDARDLERRELYDIIWTLADYVNADVLRDLGISKAAAGRPKPCIQDWYRFPTMLGDTL